MTRLETPRKIPMRRVYVLGGEPEKKPKISDTAITGNPQAAMDFITNILNSYTDSSVIAKDLAGKILLSNEGARRLYYGYEPDEVVGKINSSILHTPNDVEARLPQRIIGDAHRHGNSRAQSRAGAKAASNLAPSMQEVSSCN